MNKPKLTIDEVQSLHQAGHWEEALQGYTDLLKINPEDAHVLHLLGILYAEIGDLDSALRYVEKAVSLQPENSVLYLHLANILKAKGLFGRAEEILQSLIQINPNFAAAFNNLGTVYFAEDKYQEAIKSYQAAITLQPNYADAYYNLGLALTKLNYRSEAVNAYQALIELRQNHPGARFQLGCLLMDQNQYQAAITHFIVIEEEHPYHFETQSNLATCYLKLGRLDKAKLHYLKALDIIPDDVQILYNLGVIHMQQGLLSEAINYYLQVLKINPDSYEAHNNLGVAYLAIKETKKALWHFRAALRLETHDEAVRHTIDILMQDKNITRSPTEYIRALFDSYADHFDSHLKQSLDYQVPFLFYQRLKDYHDFNQANWDILDLGCGTGLCGEAVRSAARSLTGIDLSEKMLAEAAKKYIYDALIQSDILSFLENNPAQFDLVMAGDVIVYFGELEAIFSAVSQALRLNGLFIFNAEINVENNYAMAKSGRFNHSKAYLDSLIAQNQFTLLSYQVVRMRTQNQQPVLGHIYLLKKGMT